MNRLLELLQNAQAADQGGAVRLGLLQFALAYLLLVVVLVIMRYAKVDKTRLLLVASLRMTVQLVLTGFVLTYIFANPHPAFTLAFLAAMTAFSIHRVLDRQRGLNRRFQLAVGLSLGFSSLAVLGLFVCVVVGQSFFNPQYTIPLSGMIMGNAMTGVGLALRSFTEGLDARHSQIESLLNLGAEPQDILAPFVREALETALLPTINSMLGMGIVFLPGMMTGQILSGTLPTTAIVYQIAIMLAICASTCLTVFFALHWGHRTLWNQRKQIALAAKE